MTLERKWKKYMIKYTGFLTLYQEMDKLKNALAEERKVKAELERTKKKLETEIDEINEKFGTDRLAIHPPLLKQLIINFISSKDKAKWEKSKRKLEKELKEVKQKLEEQEAAKSENENNMWKLEEELEGLREEVDKEKKLR